MEKTSVISARIDAATLAKVDKIVAASGRSRAWFAAQAIREMAEQEAHILELIMEGEAAADVGDLIPHEQVMRELDAMIEHHRQR